MVYLNVSPLRTKNKREERLEERLVYLRELITYHYEKKEAIMQSILNVMQASIKECYVYTTLQIGRFKRTEWSFSISSFILAIQMSIQWVVYCLTILLMLIVISVLIVAGRIKHYILR